MRENNPTRDPVVRAKIAASSKGRTFLARGGNGQLTKQQIALAAATGFPVEFSILTTPVKGSFPSLPHAYKVDLAIPEIRLAIEVDGKTHLSKKWRFLDARKTAVLRALGWRVLRFWNQEVDRNMLEVLKTIQSCTALRLKEITTSMQMEFLFQTVTA
jgi:hypothetical protein